MTKRVLVTATYEIEVEDELAVRDAGFKTRMANPSFASAYKDQEDDDVKRSLSVLFGHRLPKSVDGIRVVKSTIVQADL